MHPIYLISIHNLLYIIANSNFTADIYTKKLLAIFLLKSWLFLLDFLVKHSLKRLKQTIDKNFQFTIVLNFQTLSEFTIVLIKRETISVWSNFKLLSVVNQMNKTKCFAGDFIDNKRSLKFCIQNPGLLKNWWENANCSFFNVSTDNLIVESLALLSWSLFRQVLEANWNILFSQIKTGIKIFNNKNYKVTFGFDYIYKTWRHVYINLHCTCIETCILFTNKADVNTVKYMYIYIEYIF